MGGEEVGRWVGAFACQHVYYTCTTNMSYLLFLCISVLYMVIGDNYQVAVWFVEVLVSRSRLRAGLSGFYCLDDLHLESPARLGVVNSYLRYELVSYTNYD